MFVLSGSLALLAFLGLVTQFGLRAWLPACLFARLVACFCLPLLTSARFGLLYLLLFLLRFRFCLFRLHTRLLACLPACLLACWQKQDEAEFKMNCAFRFACYPGLQAKLVVPNGLKLDFRIVFFLCFPRGSWLEFSEFFFICTCIGRLCFDKSDRTN